MNYEIDPQGYFQRLGLKPARAFALSQAFVAEHELYDECGAPEVLLLDYAIRAGVTNKRHMQRVLIDGCRQGDLLAVCTALAHVSPNIRWQGQTPLHLAHAYPGIVLALLEHKADIEARNEDGLTPLQLADHKGFAHTTLVLLARGATI